MPEPPRTLGHFGRKAWDDLMTAYVIDDTAGREMLCEACQSLDRAERLSEQINANGEVVQTRVGGVKEHPALKAELACRQFYVRTLQRLGLNYEAIQKPGRPSKKWDDDE